MVSEARERRVGKYQIKKVLGTGSMGVVYLAYDEELAREVAVKTLFRVSPSALISSESLLEKIQLEARFAGKLRHPHIVRVLDVGKEGETPFIVMDYVAGKGLDTLVQGRKPAETELVLHVLAQVAGALDYAHQQGIVHRDLKPANILLTESREAFIVDFGVASISETMEESKARSPATAVVGSAGYMSPEQIRGEPLDKRSDLFSLAIVAFELLTGVRPFPGENATAVVTRIINSPPQSAFTLNARLKQGIDAIFLRALEKDREKRFGSATEFVAALQAHLITVKPVREEKIIGNMLPVPVVVEEKKGPSLESPSGPLASKLSRRAHAHARASQRFRSLSYALAFACSLAGILLLYTVLSEKIAKLMKPRENPGVYLVADNGSPPSAMSDPQLTMFLRSSVLSDERARELLREAERRAFPDIVELAAVVLRSSGPLARVEALKIIRKTGDIRVSGQVIIFLEDPSAEVRLESVRTLLSFRDRQLTNFLSSRLLKEHDPEVKAELLKGLDQLNSL